MTDQEPTGKGRPTPKRSEAEAARKQSVKVPRDKKGAKRAMRERASAERVQQRNALYTGEERFLPSRDQGPIRKAIRKYVDSRLSTGEVFLPVALLVMFAAFVQNKAVIIFVNTIWTLMLLLVIIDGIWVATRISKLVKSEYPESARRSSHVGYGVVRSMTMRLMRLPKPMYSIGGKPRTPKVPKAQKAR
jgi:hypothetical protein